MSTNPEQLGKDLVDLYALATRVEGKGQLNVGKILRGAADAIVRRQAFQHGLSTDMEEIISGIRTMGDRLKAHHVTNDFAPLLDRAAALLQTGEQSYLRDFPNPYVCRRCGEAAVRRPPEVCSECGAVGQTFKRFEAIYWLSEYDPHEVMEHLAATPQQLERSIRGMSEQTANRQLPREVTLLQQASYFAAHELTHVRQLNAMTGI